MERASTRVSPTAPVFDCFSEPAAAFTKHSQHSTLHNLITLHSTSPHLNPIPPTTLPRPSLPQPTSFHLPTPDYFTPFQQSWSWCDHSNQPLVFRLCLCCHAYAPLSTHPLPPTHPRRPRAQRPARSAMLSRDVVVAPSAFVCCSVIVNTACEREDAEFMSVDRIVRVLEPIARASMIASALATRGRNGGRGGAG